eukprot:m.300287 g.300287  ORF g.300287 m.300287 type:complete len:54 (-) comp27248_c0_seq1:853-1014(-)
MDFHVSHSWVRAPVTASLHRELVLRGVLACGSVVELPLNVDQQRRGTEAEEMR